MNNKTAGIIVALIGIVVGLIGIFSIQGYLEDMRNLAILGLLAPQSALIVIFIVGIMIFTIPDYFWLLMYIGFGICFFGALLAALD
ncbi:MAG: hypothetical protein ACTSRG_15425 [Candidatus Helarchaeota archaeon]